MKVFYHVDIWLKWSSKDLETNDVEEIKMTKELSREEKQEWVSGRPQTAPLLNTIKPHEMTGLLRCPYFTPIGLTR